MKYEEVLDEWIKQEGEKMRAGSGDDQFYVDQVGKYVNKQRKFWIDFMKFIENKILNYEALRARLEEVKKC